MRRSKLELQLDILKVVEHGGPISPTQIMYEVNICYKFLEQHLDHLMKHNLIERETLGQRRAKYVITQNGINLLGNYGEIMKTLEIGVRVNI